MLTPIGRRVSLGSAKRQHGRFLHQGPTCQKPSLDNFSTGRLHLLQGRPAALIIHGAGGIAQEPDPEPRSQGIHYGLIYADIQSQTADPKSSDPFFLQLDRQPGLVEGRILILVTASPFLMFS
jgi:hypothetical protein